MIPEHLIAYTRLSRLAVLTELASFEAEALVTFSSAIPGGDAREIAGIESELTRLFLKSCEWLDAMREAAKEFRKP